MSVAKALNEAAANEQFAALLAHELRNPLMPLRDAALALAHLDGNDPRNSSAHAIIQRQVQTIADVVQTIVEISTLAGDAVQADPLASLEQSVVDALEAARVRAALFDVRIVVTTQIPDVMVRFERLALERVMGIMLDYAIHQTRPASEMTCGVRLKTGAAVFEVTESARGLTDVERVSLFDLETMSHRVPDSIHGGRVALYLAKRLTGRYHGSLRCTSRGLGTGSKLALHIPLV